MGIGGWHLTIGVSTSIISTFVKCFHLLGKLIQLDQNGKENQPEEHVHQKWNTGKKN